MRCNIGIYNLHLQARGGGEKLTLALAEHLSLAHNVQLFCAEPLDIPFLEEYFAVDLSRVTVTPLNRVGPFLRVLEKVRGWRGPAFSLHHYLQLKKLELDVFINNSYASGLRCPAARGIFMCMFPHSKPRLLDEHLMRKTGRTLIDWIEKQVTNFAGSNAVDSYPTIVAISQYSAHWVHQMWGRRSEIIYPPCDEMGPPVIKRQIILHVGRFIADRDDGRHHKGQGLLLEAFKQMTDLHREGWELHFAGSVATDEYSETFTRKLMQDAGGIPVFFHFNAARHEIRDLFQSAAIYWHATGYGFNVDTCPARQEHFGISTVEAMSAAAVPVVYSSGGQKEIVTDEVDGLWWDHIEGLINQTQRLANDPALRCRLGQQGVLSSKQFGREAFAANVDQLIAKVVSEHPLQG
jgi:glycosyltransferase involved in cell wall biosynthesis